jgi:hypothetical protein
MSLQRLQGAKMNIPISVGECEQIGRFHYLLASGHYNGDGQMTALEKKDFFIDARHWFERAYIYGGSEFSWRYTRICEEHIAELNKKCRPQPALYAMQSR